MEDGSGWVTVMSTLPFFGLFFGWGPPKSYIYVKKIFGEKKGGIFGKTNILAGGSKYFVFFAPTCGNDPI